MTVGMLFAFTSFKQHFEGKAENLVTKLIQFKMLELYFHRIADIAHTRKESGLDSVVVEAGHTLTGGLSLDGVTFSLRRG